MAQWIRLLVYYLVSLRDMWSLFVCFPVTNWFYPLDNWDIDVEKSYSYSIVKKGSEVLIEEFLKQKEFENTKEKIEKI